MLTGDGIAEPNLGEHLMAHPRINERDYSVESEYEYGSRAGFWRMFRLLSKHGLKFTLYAVAQALERNVDVARRCAEAGHYVASHTYRWIDYHDFPVDREREYIKKAVLSLKALTGYAPRGWYYGRPSPHSRSLVPAVYEELGEELVGPATPTPTTCRTGPTCPWSGTARSPRGA